jgi:hypothetical protein
VFLVRSSPLPASLAGGLAPAFRQGFRIRVVNRGIPDGYAAAFRHRQPPPDLLLLEPRRQPCGRPLGVLRVLRFSLSRSHAEPCGPTRALEVSLAFFLPGALRPPVRRPGVPRSSTGRSLRTRPQPALSTWPDLRPGYRSLERVATSPPSLSVLVTLAGAPTVQRDVPQAPASTRLCCTGPRQVPLDSFHRQTLRSNDGPQDFPYLRPELTSTEAISRNPWRD